MARVSQQGGSMACDPLHIPYSLACGDGTQPLGSCLPSQRNTLSPEAQDRLWVPCCLTCCLCVTLCLCVRPPMASLQKLP